MEDQQEKQVVVQVIQQVPPRTNGLCVASFIIALVCLLSSFFLFPLLGSVLALIFGIIGVKSARKRNEAGRGLGIAGIVISSISLSGVVIIASIMLACAATVPLGLIGGQMASQSLVVNKNSDEYKEGFEAGKQYGALGKTTGKEVQKREALTIRVSQVKKALGDDSRQETPSQKKDYMEGYLDGYYSVR